MNKLVILDYNVGTVDIYDIEKVPNDIEKYLTENLDYNLNNCEWMVGNMDITFHKEVLNECSSN